MKLKAEPAVTLEDALMAKWLAAAAATEMLLLVPLIEELAMSVALTVWFPALLRMALKLPVPLVKELSAASTAWPSLLLK